MSVAPEQDVAEPGSRLCEIWIFSITGAILIGLSGILPLFLIPLESGPSLKHGDAARKLRLMLSFAVGSLLGDVFLHLLPEVWAQVDKDKDITHLKVGLWVISGLLMFMVVEKLMGDEAEFEHLPDVCDEDPSEPKTDTEKQRLNQNSNGSVLKSKEVRGDKQKVQKHKTSDSNRKGSSLQKVNKDKSHTAQKSTAVVQEKATQQSTAVAQEKATQQSTVVVAQEKPANIKVSGYLNLMANIVDNFTHGLAVSASFCISTKVGLVTTLAILLHEIPHEVGDFAILLRSGFDKWRAAKAQFLTALGGVVGAVTTLTAESALVAGKRTAWILPFTSGGFMYIALVTVVPDLLQERHGWESIKQVACICLGVLSMAVVTLAFD